jgi:serine/threonine-protein kinase
MPGFNSERMLLEAKVVNQVGHPNIVDIFETGLLEDGRPYIVMERLDGQSLAVRADEGKLLPDQVIAILLQVCDALIAAHAAGIIHRDLKLDNVFLSDNPDDPTQPRVKLLDWGIAKVIHHEVHHTIEGQLMGTPQYLSPEQARGQVVSPATDVYSLGVMAYELFLEQLPFEAETAAEVMAMHLRATPPPPRELWPDMPRELEDLLLAMLAKQADRRPSMAEVARRLEAVRGELDRRCLARGGARLRSVPPVRRTPSRPVRRVSGVAPTESFSWRYETRRWQVAIGGLALALGGLLFWISHTGDRAAIAATAPAELAPAAVVAPHHARVPSSARVAQPDAAEAPEASDSSDGHDAAAGVAMRTAEARPGDLVIAPAVVTESAPLATHRRIERAPAAHAPAPRTASRPSSSSPAVPRLRAKVDPDGTLDVYR